MPGRTSRGWSSRCRARASRATGGLPGRALAPVFGQQVVEHVVDGHRAEQVVSVVHDRNGDEVVGRQVGRDLRQGDVRPEWVDVPVGHAGDERTWWLAQQSLDVRDAEELAGGRVRWL